MEVKKLCEVCGSASIQFQSNIKDHSISKQDFLLLKCADCHFLFTGNAPTEENAGAFYQSEDYISHSDTSKGLVSKLYHSVRDIMLGKKKALLDHLGAKKTLLDVGSGTGYFLAHMQKHGYQTKGIEIDDKARSFSINQFGLDVGSPEKLLNNQINSTFGYITLWHVLEHLYRPNDYLQAMKALLDDDGYLIIALPNYTCFDAKYYDTFWAGYDVPRHLWHFTPKSLDLMLKNNGFEIISKELMPFDPFYNAMLSEKYKNNPLGLIRGCCTGFISLCLGTFNVDKASSIIYTIKKK